MTKGMVGCARVVFPSAPYAPSAPSPLHGSRMAAWAWQAVIYQGAFGGTQEQVEAEAWGAGPGAAPRRASLAWVTVKSRRSEASGGRHALMAFAAAVLRRLPWQVHFHSAWTRSS